MNKLTKQLAIEAGFKIFGNTVVAADNGSSGDATKCLEKFVELMIAEFNNVCLDRAISAEFSYTPSRATVARKTAVGCANIMKEKFGE